MRYCVYKPLIEIPNYISSNVVPENIFHAQQYAFEQVKKVIPNPLEWLKTKLAIESTDELMNIILPEQMDSVLMAIYNIEHTQHDFIIGDETGIGKGRILASIMRYALNQNKRVLFVTEAPHLFSDFWRDMANTQTAPLLNVEKELFLLHDDAKIFDEQNILVMKSHTKLKEMLKNGVFQYQLRKVDHVLQPKVIMTTYSQFSRKQSAEKKMNLLKKFLQKDSIIIFDEFHNAVGDSHTHEMKDKIVALGGHVVQSSATFLNDYRQISSFKKSFKLGSNDLKLLHALYQNSNDGSSYALNNQLAVYLTQQGMLLRREHDAVVKNNYHYIHPKEQEKIEHHFTLFNQIFERIFQFYHLLSNNKAVNNEELKNKWVVFGGIISRLGRVILLTGKKDSIIQLIEEALKQDKKVFLTMESTYESLMNLCLEENKQQFDLFTPEQGYDFLNFAYLLKMTTKKTLYDSVKSLNDFVLMEEFEQLLADIDAFPPIHLSFIDDIHQYFNSKGIKTLELSGRQYRAIYENGVHRIEKREAEHKSSIIYQFNNQTDSNILISTRVGATGASLQAAANFKDQRVRLLIEAEISARVKIRKQFYGRVDRRNQVRKPEYCTPLSSIPFEKRIVRLEEIKMQKMRSFIGSDYEISSFEGDYYNEYANYLAKMYLMCHRDLAKKIGISIYSNEDLYHIDMILKRSVLMTYSEQENFFEYLDSGLEIYQESEISRHQTFKIKQDFQFQPEKVFLDNMMGKGSLSGLKQIEDYQTLSPIVYQILNKQSAIIPAITENDLHQTWNHQFDREQFKLRINKAFVPHWYYFHQDMISKNLNQFKQIDLGKQIVFQMNGENYYGYIEDIRYPQSMQYARYPSHYLISVRLIQPEHLKSNNRVWLNQIQITGSILVENNRFILSDKPIEWKKYVSHKEKILERETRLLMGNWFYLNLVRHVYQMGDWFSFTHQQQQMLALKMPNGECRSPEHRVILNKEDCIKRLNEKYFIQSHDMMIMVRRIEQNDKTSFWEWNIHNDALFKENIFNYYMKEKMHNTNGVVHFMVNAPQELSVVLQQYTTLDTTHQQKLVQMYQTRPYVDDPLSGIRILKGVLYLPLSVCEPEFKKLYQKRTLLVVTNFKDLAFLLSSLFNNPKIFLLS